MDIFHREDETRNKEMSRAHPAEMLERRNNGRQK
jgi:hypothetical protein